MSVRTKDIPLELPLIPIRNRVIFPGSVVRLNIGRAKSLKIVEHINRGLKRTRGGGFSNDGSGNGGEDAAGAAGGAGAGANAKSVLSPKDNVFVALATIRSPSPSSSEEENKDGPSSSSSAAGPPIYPVGVVVRVAQMSRAGKELWTMLVEGVIRFEVSEFTQANPFW